MKKKILSVGEIIWDVFPSNSVIGGAPLNFAAHAALCGAESFLMSAVGMDSLGDSALSALSDFGVNPHYVKRTDKPTGQCMVTLGHNAIPQYNVLQDVAYDHIMVTNEDIENINAYQYDVLYFGTLIQRASTSRNTIQTLLKKCKFKEIMCDINLRPNCYDLDSILCCLENATILKVSMEEEEILRTFNLYTAKSNCVNDIAKAICDKFRNIKFIILTLGKDGSYVLDSQNHQEYVQCAIGDTLVSTVGAGDSFSAAWITNFLDGKCISECMKKAAELSGFVVGHIEAVPKY